MRESLATHNTFYFKHLLTNLRYFCRNFNADLKPFHFVPLLSYTNQGAGYFKIVNAFSNVKMFERALQR